MKISWTWLQEWIDLDGLEVDEVVERLTMVGLEVDGVEVVGEGHDDVVVARIEAIRAHPNADKLVLCDVDHGSGSLRQVACGATNMAEGDRVALALPGSRPPGIEFEIASRKVRGERSDGMLCSAEELGLESEGDGLMILAPGLEVGAPIFAAMGLKDTVIEVDLTPNRPDCLSHRGVARELSAMLGRDLKVSVDQTESAAWEDDPVGSPASEVASLEVDDSEGCPRYLFAVVEGVRVGPSPAWLQRHLAAVGLRSVNNLVDVTNYILMDVGQPLHAFDLDKLEGACVEVRRAEQGERMVGIDHQEYVLGPDDLVIADAGGPVAVAGVMGGERTEVTESTTRVLIECAYFEPTTVRKTSKRLGLHTDSSHRFERGVDPGGLEFALQRAVRLLLRAQEHLGAPAAKVRSGIGYADTPGFGAPACVELDRGQCQRVLGVKIAPEEVVAHLESLGMSLEASEAGWAVAVPSFRPDLTRPIDLVEEVARLHGYDKIEPKLPHALMGGGHRRRSGSEGTHRDTIVPARTLAQVDAMRSQLRACGFFEVINYGFMSDRDLDRLRLPEGDARRDAVELANPLVAADRYMQTTLLPGLLKNLETNLAQRNADLALYEVGRRYGSEREPQTMALLVTGALREDWSGRRGWDFFDLKGVIEGLARPFNTGGLTWRVPAEGEPFLHPGVEAVWAQGDRDYVRAGQLHPEVARELDLGQPVYVAEVDLEGLLALPREERGYRRLSRYPAVKRDFALVCDEGRPWGDVAATIEELAKEEGAFGRFLEDYRLFDVYQGDQLPEGKRSLALTVVYRSAERTLTDRDVEQADQVLIARLAERLDAQLR